MDESLSILKFLKALHPPRILAFLVILLGAVVLTLAKPESLVSHFGSTVNFLSRTWIAASLIATIAISFWIYLVNIGRIEKASRKLLSTEHHDAVISLQQRCYAFNVGIIMLALLACIAAAFWTADEALAVINLFSGMILVAVILVLDIHIALISHRFLQDKESQDPNKAKRNAHEAELTEMRARFLGDRDVILKLDVPILVGVSVAWVLGYMILPQVLGPVDEAYAKGFVTGATALQLLIGNVAFEIIDACASS